MMNGRQVLSFGISKSKGSSDVTVFDEGARVLHDLERENPKVHFRILYSGVDYIKNQYKSAMEALIEGAVLAVLVVFLFLRDIRATLISAVAIPLSAIPTFWFMDLLGFTLNGISLLALSLVAGVLVDDAIVEIENIVRHMRMGKTAYQASIDAADEIGLAVVATTFSIVAVFLPVGVMPGIAGQFFKQFGFTVVVAVLISLAVARLITPMLCAYFLRAKGHAKHGEGWLMDRYMRLLKWSLGHRWWTVAMGVVAFILTGVTAATLPLTFQPTINTDYSQISIELVPGSTLEQTQRIAEQVSRIVRTAPEVASAFSDINVGQAEVFLTLRKDRHRTSVEFERSMAPRLNQIADARVSFSSQQGGGSGRDTSRSRSAATIRCCSTTPRSASSTRCATCPRWVAPRVFGDTQPPGDHDPPAFRTSPPTWRHHRGAVADDPDRDDGRYRSEQRQISRSATARFPIRVSLAEDSRRNLSTLQNLPVPTTTGGTVPLHVVADVSFGAGPTTIRRYNQARRIMIGADLAPGLVTGEALPKVHALPHARAFADRRAGAQHRLGQVAARNAAEFRYRRGLGHPARVRGAGAALPPAACRRWSIWARCCWRRWGRSSRSISPAMPFRCRCSSAC